MIRQGTLWIMHLIPALLLSAGGCAMEDKQESSGALDYLDLIEHGLTQTRSNLPHISASAEQASQFLLAGGKIWADGSQAGFDGEAAGRAGGLMNLQRIGNSTPASGDIILYAAPGTLNQQDLQKIKAWQSQGLYVVAFASRTPQGPAPTWLMENSSPPGLVIMVSDQPKLIPADTVLNVINLWVWTGELAAACTRAGKMPVHYKSHCLPGGTERTEKYRGQLFHDNFKIAPIEPGLLGTEYLNVIKTAVNSLRSEQINRIRRVARWWLTTPTKDVSILHISHLFPAHLQDPRSPGRFNNSAYNIGQNGIEQTPRKEMLVISLSYQQPPTPIIEQAKTSGMRFVYNSVRSVDIPEPTDNIVYIKPAWPLPDACVKVPGYDVDILPASGACNAITYWSILAEAYETPTANSPKPINTHDH